eukprot:510802_1
MNHTKSDIIADLRLENISHPADVYYKSKSKSLTWTSMPNIYEHKNGGSYYYVLHKPKKSGETLHISASKIINKNRKYKKHIKKIMKTTSNTQYRKHLNKVLNISKKEKYQKKYYKKGLKEGFKQAEKNGKTMAYEDVFNSTMNDMGRRMRGNMTRQRYGTNKLIKSRVNDNVMKEVGLKKLKQMQKDKNLLKTYLGGLKKENKYGTFTSYQIGFNYNEKSKLYKMGFSMKYKDKNKITHRE